MTLIDRLSKLDGPRYVVDVAIALETDFWPQDRIKRVVYNDNGDPTVWFTDGPDMPLPPAYTASVDAAIALAERVLPGWGRSCDATMPESGIEWTVYGPEYDFTGSGSNDAIALCIALLRAKEASHGE